MHLKHALIPLALIFALPGSSKADGPELIERGEAIYRESCLACHGEDGQGVEDQYPDPLVGDLTVGGLSEVIADTMPEEDPDACVGEDASAVAAFIHHAFYSEAARIRNRPPRVALARLTATQLRQSCADLFGSFHDPGWIEDGRGVKAIYFDGARWKNDNKKIERVDPVIDFDFGHDGPGEGINPEDFYIHWSGSIKVDRSGRYEMVLRSSCSCTMDFGDNDRQLINNHVQSAGKEEFRRTMHLTAGRAYPFEIDFFQRKRKTEQPPARISLSWVPPGGVETIIPTRQLLPSQSPATFSLQAKLPPDDRSYGYERGTSVDRGWDDSVTAAALEMAQIAVDELYPRYRRLHRKDADDNREKLRGFLRNLVETAFRGPLDDETRQRYIDRQVDATEDDAEAIKRVILLAMKSPRFLYPTLDDHRSRSQRTANRLALVLFDSLPSEPWLVKMIDKNQLQTRKQIAEAARKMVNDYRTQAKTRDFLHEWFEVAELEEITKDSEAFPGFDPALLADLRDSFDAFLDEIVWSEASDFRQLLQADWAFTSDRLAEFYGEAWKAASPDRPDEGQAGAELKRSVSDSKVHVGAITHPLVMSRLAHHKVSSPIHRGVFLTNQMLGRVIRPPNAAFTPLNPDLHPNLTTRERVELQTGEVNCQVCHGKINALGFALENFDAAGKFRDRENNKPINAKGRYVSLRGEEIAFDGARELGDYLAGSSDCHRAFVEAAFEHFVKQPVAAFGPETAERLTRSFRESGFNVQELIVSIAVIASQQPPPTISET